MFSIITPTYNRANTLYRVYDSLQSQTYKSFEWIIIDDFSADETEDLVKKWISNNNTFEIKYYKLPENMGKPYALNFGFPYCSQKITIIADSDDTFEPNTLSDLKIMWDGIDLTISNKNIGAIWTLVKDESGQLVGEKFPFNFWQVGLKERVLDRNKQIAGEKWSSWRTAILKKYKMYCNPNSFISEGVTWNKINKEYDFLCINIIHRTYWDSPDGLINQKKTKLKIEKKLYYNSYHYLNETSMKDILKHKFYWNIAFNYTKALFYYRDKVNCLKGLKLLLVGSIFVCVLPKRLLYKLK